MLYSIPALAAAVYFCGYYFQVNCVNHKLCLISAVWLTESSGFRSEMTAEMERTKLHHIRLRLLMNECMILAALTGLGTGNE